MLVYYLVHYFLYHHHQLRLSFLKDRPNIAVKLQQAVMVMSITLIRF